MIKYWVDYVKCGIVACKQNIVAAKMKKIEMYILKHITVVLEMRFYNDFSLEEFCHFLIKSKEKK